MWRTSVLLCLLLSACGDPPSEGWLEDLASDESPTVETRVAQLAKVGIGLRDGVKVRQLFDAWSREDLASSESLLMAMGAESSDGWLSNDVWHFDRECIEGEGSYVRIAERLRALAHGHFEMEALKDEFHPRFGTPRLSFRVGNHKYQWSLHRNEDWVDMTVFRRFETAVLAKHARGQRIIWLDLDGQDLVILMGDEARLKQLRDATRLDLQWLNP